MKTILVYRLEDEDRRGPYGRMPSYNDLLDAHDGRAGLRTIAHRGMSAYLTNDNKSDWYSGMNSFRNLDEWFRPFVDMLLDDGYALSVYEVIDDDEYRYVHDDGQVFFRMDAARRIE